VDDGEWDGTVFTMLYPDALVRHLGIAVLDRIEAAGFEPIAWHVLWHRPEDLDSFYGRNITEVWHTYLYRLVDQLFALGPTVGMLVADRQPTAGPTCYRRLVQAKGASDPARAAPGTIRADLGSINKILSLVHSSDGRAESIEESTVFAGPSGFTRGQDPGELRTLIALLQAGTPPENRGYREVLAGLRARTLAAAWEDVRGSARKKAAAILDEGPAALARPGGGERLSALLPDAHPLSGVLRADFTPQSPGPEPERAALTLAPFGVRLDDWESLVLATSRRFWPRGANVG
jgi:nucleoside diphosphate kinase